MTTKSKSMWPPHPIQAQNGAKFSDWACKLVVALSHYIDPPMDYHEISSAMALYYKEAKQPPHMQELCEQLRHAPPGLYDQLFLDEVELDVGYWRERAQAVISNWRRKEGKGPECLEMDCKSTGKGVGSVNGDLAAAVASDSDDEPDEAVTPRSPKASSAA